jgi:hypothetical protein
MVVRAQNVFETVADSFVQLVEECTEGRHRPMALQIFLDRLTR